MGDDQPSAMLAILLGASTFPNAPKLAEGRAFYISANDVKDYLCDQHGLGLPRRNILSLFDDSRSPSDQLMEVANFLVRRKLELKNEGCRPEALLIYYVGHGLFTRGDQAYCLAVRSTNEINEGATSIRAGDLAGVIKENAAFLRRYLILDCCFAASIHKEFQSGALIAARVQIANEFPERGTALLCSSNAREPSLAPQELDHTMFSSALIQSLREGFPSGGPRFSFSELGDLIKENLRNAYPDSWVRPEVHSPDQREGDIASIPLFPNKAYREREPAADRAHEEHQWQEHDRAAAAEHERAAAAEKERVAAAETVHAADRDAFAERGRLKEQHRSSPTPPSHNAEIPITGSTGVGTAASGMPFQPISGPAAGPASGTASGHAPSSPAGSAYARTESLPLDELTRQLAIHIGPVAKFVVENFAAQFTDINRIYDEAAKQISSEAGRKEFLSSRRG